MDSFPVIGLHHAGMSLFYKAPPRWEPLVFPPVVRRPCSPVVNKLVWWLPFGSACFWGLSGQERVSVKQMTGVWWVCVPCMCTGWGRAPNGGDLTGKSLPPLILPLLQPIQNGSVQCALLPLLPQCCRAWASWKHAFPLQSGNELPLSDLSLLSGNSKWHTGQMAGWPATLSVLYLLRLDVCLVRDW